MCFLNVPQNYSRQIVLFYTEAFFSSLNNETLHFVAAEFVYFLLRCFTWGSSLVPSQLQFCAKLLGRDPKPVGTPTTSGGHVCCLNGSSLGLGA